ncbi:hypothetical protein AVEN_266112-1 [Araneus ventricosus]|uniref:Uncharacterized protein n=1 Tax=Araneus ventricosus TaxID=182803 RepID=A0A4Y2L019_ARAVE|nr:hypothetical protein AVEN_266112-1 [Araneus ventricosus]
MFFRIIVVSTLFLVLSKIPEISSARRSSICTLDHAVLRHIPRTTTAFHVFCGNLEQYFGCVDRNRELFVGKNIQKLTRVQNILQKAENFVRKKLCRKENWQQDFLRNATCFRRIWKSRAYCKKFADLAIEKYEEKIKQTNLSIQKFMNVTRECMEVSMHAVCFSVGISEICGFDANYLYMKIFDGTRYYSIMCPQYKYEEAQRRAAIIASRADLKICISKNYPYPCLKVFKEENLDEYF